MKKIKMFSIYVVSLFILLISCDLTEDDYDGKYYNTSDYSGVIVGSTGAYYVHLSEKCYATVLFDGIIYNLSYDEPFFEGEKITLTDGTISITLTDRHDGVSIAFDIPGHDIKSTINLESDPNNPNRNYIGWSENFRNGERVYKTTINLTLYKNGGNKWSGIEKVIFDSNPDDPNHQSDVGNFYILSGVFEENDSSVTLKWNEDQEIFTLDKINNKLTRFDGGTTTFEVELTKVDF